MYGWREHWHGNLEHCNYLTGALRETVVFPLGTYLSSSPTRHIGTRKVPAVRDAVPIAQDQS